MIEGVHHIAILCSDRQRALRFYVDALGFTLERAVPRPERGDEIVFLRGYGTTLELFVAPDHPPRQTQPEAYGLRHLAFRVPSVENAVAHLHSLGVEPEPIRQDSVDGMNMTFVKDPDGLPIELHE